MFTKTKTIIIKTKVFKTKILIIPIPNHRHKIDYLSIFVCFNRILKIFF